jgi:hypothetical protein
MAVMMTGNSQSWKHAEGGVALLESVGENVEVNFVMKEFPTYK